MEVNPDSLWQVPKGQKIDSRIQEGAPQNWNAFKKVAADDNQVVYRRDAPQNEAKRMKIYSHTDKVSVHGILVKNTPNSILPDDVYEIFKKFGEIQRIKVRPVRKTKLEDFGSKLGSSEIYFTKKSDALEATKQMDKEHIFRRFYF